MNNKRGVNSPPASVTEDIIKYLEQQNLLASEDEGSQDSGEGLERVRSILEEIIANIAYRAQLIDEFQARLKAHNQYPLFDLSKIIPNFFIDEELYKKLSFRETLMISTFKSTSSFYVPEIVGGLCLDIQIAQGANPLIRKDVGFEQELIELITFKANELRNASKLVTKNSGPKPSQVSVGKDSLEKSVELTESKQEIDNFIKSLKPRYERPQCKFLVHLSSQFDVCGHSGGSRITAWVDRNFHTLEEKRSEYVMEEDGENEKVLYCGLQARNYYVMHRSTMEKLLDRKYYSMGKTRDLVCEGANFILMRYLAVTRYIGTFELSTMYINGNMCRNIYECRGPESGIINNQKLDLCRIYRTVIEECGIVHNCITMLTLSGQLMKQEWDDCDYILQVNPLSIIKSETPLGNEHLLLEKVWETDMQLFSAFLDAKTTNSMHMKSYLIEHPEFKNMMADYVQATLHMKPEDVLDFTIKHFTQFYPHVKPQKHTEEEEEDEFHIVT